jgi:hypothetical protein
VWKYTLFILSNYYYYFYAIFKEAIVGRIFTDMQVGLTSFSKHTDNSGVNLFK